LQNEFFGARRFGGHRPLISEGEQIDWTFAPVIARR
jgi:hypothetical protein